jgi:hypothetical protein
MDRLRRRRWEHIRTKWLNHIPYFDTAGERPSGTVAQVFGFDEIATRLAALAKAEYAKANTSRQQTGILPPLPLTTFEEELAGIREAVFGESLFLLHKSRHVLGTTELQARQGFRTWALANAYQGAFFAAKGTLGLLGVSLPEHNSKAVAVDLFPNPVVSGDNYSFATFHYLGMRLEHRPIWEMFQRLIAVSAVDFWPKHIVNKLKSIESKNFAKQRNDIHYRNCGWLLDDLHDVSLKEGFGSLSAWADGLDFDNEDVSMALAFSVLKLGLLLVQDLEKSSAKLSPEIKLLSACVDNGRHPMYGEFLLS